MRIILAAINATYNHTNLAIRYIAGYLKGNTADISGTDILTREFSINENEDRALDMLISDEGDVYAFSCYIWNIKFVLSLTADLKKILPDVKIILGGPEVSYEDMSFFEKNPQIDIIISGSGEKALSGLLTDGLFATDKKIIKGETVLMVEKPFPYEKDKTFDKGRQYYYETSTGCPFSCSYCLSGGQKGVDVLPLERVKKELDRFISGKAKIVKLVDRTFNFDDKRACDIWKYLIGHFREKPFDTMFHFEISADLLSDMALDLLKTAPTGIFRFECGVQSTNKNVLKSVQRRSDLSKILININKLAKLGNIELHVDLIAGLPGDTPETMADSFNEVYSTGAGMVQLGFLKVLKGSLIREQASDLGMVYSDEPPYRILSTPSMSYRNIGLLRDIARMTEIYYNSGNFRFSVDHLIKSKYSGDPFMLYRGLSEYYRKQGGFTRNFSMKDNILTLLKFSKKALSGDTETCMMIFRDLLKFDKYRYDARGEIFELEMNMSSRHPDIPAGVAEAFGKKALSGSGFRVRCEKYCFNVRELIDSGSILTGQGFVLYDISGDRPVIIETAFSN